MLFVRLFDLRLFGLSVSSSCWCLGRIAACDCDTPWTFLSPFCMLNSMCINLHIKYHEMIFPSGLVYVL